MMADAAKFLGMQKVCFVCTANKYDEISLTEKTEVNEYSQSQGLKKYVISHQTFGLPKVNSSELLGDSPAKNAEILVNLFEKQLKYFIDCIANTFPPERNTIEESVYLLKLIDIIRTHAE